MFGISFSELLVIAVITLLVVGPEKLPEVVRSLSINLARLRRMWQSAKLDLEREVGMDEIRREIHNAEVMQQLERVRKMRFEELDPEVDGGLGKSAQEHRIQPTTDDSGTPDSPGENHVRRQAPDPD